MVKYTWIFLGISILAANISSMETSTAQEKLFQAVRFGTLEDVRQAIAEGADVNAFYEIGWRPLHLIGVRLPCAKYTADYSALIGQMLIQAGADVNGINYNPENSIINQKETPLHIAAESNFTLPFIKVLIASGAHVNACNSYGKTPLHHAAEMGNTEIMDFLLKKNGLINAQDTYGMTPLFRATMRGKEQAVKLLLQNDAQVDLRRNFGNSPLHVAAENGYSAIVRMLLNNNAWINNQDSVGDTPLHESIDRKCNYAVIYELLSRHDIDSILTNRQGHAALDKARINKDKKGVYVLARYQLIKKLLSTILYTEKGAFSLPKSLVSLIAYYSSITGNTDNRYVTP